MNEPLAIKLRPTKVSDIIGQTHLVGKNKIITNMVNNKRLFSMIYMVVLELAKLVLRLPLFRN